MTATPAWAPRVVDQSVLFWPVRAHALAFEHSADWPSVEEYDRVLGPIAGIAFRAQPPRPRDKARRREGCSYDESICERGIVPTRARSWHDHYNALVWAAFPRAKAALHRRQHEAHRLGAAVSAPGGRTREQDGLALLDEGGVALLAAEAARSELTSALDGRDADRVRPIVSRGDALGVIFGHAVYEHLATDRPAVRAMVHVVPCSAVPSDADACLALADRALADALEDPESFTRPDSFRSLLVVPELLGQRGPAGR